MATSLQPELHQSVCVYMCQRYVQTTRKMRTLTPIAVSVSSMCLHQSEIELFATYRTGKRIKTKELGAITVF